MNPINTVDCRASFVAIIKDENYFREDYSRWSLKQHWSGKDAGFADQQLQQRWHDFERGWKAALSKYDVPAGKEVGT